MNVKILRYSLYHAIHSKNIEVLSLILDECRSIYHCKNSDVFCLAHYLTGISEDNYNLLLSDIEANKKIKSWPVSRCDAAKLQ